MLFQNLLLYTLEGLKINWHHHLTAYWLRLFSSLTFSHINTPTFIKPSHSSHLPAYEDGRNRVFRNVHANISVALGWLKLRNVNIWREKKIACRSTVTNMAKLGNLEITSDTFKRCVHILCLYV
jgi:hypothetical protein